MRSLPSCVLWSMASWALLPAAIGQWVTLDRVDRWYAREHISERQRTRNRGLRPPGTLGYPAGHRLPPWPQRCWQSRADGGYCIAMNKARMQILLAITLVLAGVLLLISRLDGFGNVASAIGGALLAVGGMAFLMVFARDRNQWWALIPGCALAGLAVVAFLGRDLGVWSGGVFLGSIGAAFWLLYLFQREHWWALIPGGALFTMGLVAGLPRASAAGTFFTGLGITFALVALVPTAEGRQTWAWIPAAALALMGGLVFGGVQHHLQLAWPVALIAAGFYLVWNWSASRRRRTPPTLAESGEAAEQPTGGPPSDEADAAPDSGAD